jgi:hypothetical protein
MCWWVKLTGEGHSQYARLESAIALFGPIILRMPLPYPTLPYPGALPYPKTGKNQTGLASCVRSDCRLLWVPWFFHHSQTNGTFTLRVFTFASTCLGTFCGWISILVYIYIVVGTCDLRALWSPPVSLNLVRVLVFSRNFLFFIFIIFMCFLLLLLFCIIKIKCFFFTFVFLFIWMQVWSLEKEDTPHSFSSRVFLHYYKFYFFLFSTLYLVSSFL